MMEFKFSLCIKYTGDRKLPAGVTLRQAAEQLSIDIKEILEDRDPEVEVTATPTEGSRQ